jgi:hypothetical protein
MQEAQPSRTAMRVAMRRAAHQLFDAPAVLVDLPLPLRARLAAAGFSNIADFGRDELNARYFDGRTDGLRVRGGAGASRQCRGGSALTGRSVAEQYGSTSSHS